MLKGSAICREKTTTKRKERVSGKILSVSVPSRSEYNAKTKENLIQQINLVFLGTIGLITLTETREKRNVILHFRERFDVITSTEI